MNEVFPSLFSYDFVRSFNSKGIQKMAKRKVGFPLLLNSLQSIFSPEKLLFGTFCIKLNWFVLSQIQFCEKYVSFLVFKLFYRTTEELFLINHNNEKKAKDQFSSQMGNSSICIQMKIGTDKQFHQTVSIFNPRKTASARKTAEKTFIGKIQLSSFTDFYTFLLLHNEILFVYFAQAKATFSTRHLRLTANSSLQSFERSTPFSTLDSLIITKPKSTKKTAQYSKIKMQMSCFASQDYLK